jgi:hypothetical protein
MPVVGWPRWVETFLDIDILRAAVSGVWQSRGSGSLGDPAVSEIRATKRDDVGLNRSQRRGSCKWSLSLSGRFVCRIQVVMKRAGGGFPHSKRLVWTCTTLPNGANGRAPTHGALGVPHGLKCARVQCRPSDGSAVVREICANARIDANLSEPSNSISLRQVPR